MGKQIKYCSGKENFERMNYLYQASQLLAKKAVKSNKPEFKKCANFISTYYSNLLINVAKKTVLRIDADIKRNICKGCHGIMIPGENARVRLKKKPNQHVQWTCLKCFAIRIYCTKRDHSVWTERSEALVEVLEFDENSETDSNGK